MVEMKHEIVKLTEKNFETKKFVGGPIIISFVVAGSQTAVDSLSSDWRCLTAGWGQ